MSKPRIKRSVAAGAVLLIQMSCASKGEVKPPHPGSFQACRQPASAPSTPEGFTVSGLWASREDDPERDEIPLLAPEELAVFTTEARRIYWFARPGLKTRAANLLGTAYSASWYLPDGALYQKSAFKYSMDSGVMKAGMTIPRTMDPRTSGTWRVEIRKEYSGGGEIIDSREFCLIAIEAENDKGI